MKTNKMNVLFVGFGIVCMIVGLVALAQSTTPSGGPYYLQVPVSTWTYLIDRFSNGSYYMVNGTNWKVDYQSTNLTNVEKFALGNTTSGTVYLYGLQHNTSLSVLSLQKVIQDYQNKTTYYTSTGSFAIGDCPVSTNGTFTLTSDTSEHTIVTLTPTSVEQVTNFYLDLSELTQNCTLRVYLKIDGVNYVELTSMTLTVAAGTKGLALKDHVIDTAWKLTIQSVVAEGASRAIDYRYFVNVY
jgi:hypothetical protein